MDNQNVIFKYYICFDCHSVIYSYGNYLNETY